MLKEVKFYFNKKEFIFETKVCLGLIKFVGLMFKKKETAKILLFDFKKPTRIGIHSFFVFFDFVAVWLDEENKVIEIKKVKPWVPLLKPKKPFVKLIEIPLNKKYEKIAIELLKNNS